MGLLTNDGSIALAKMLVNSELYVAWGSGDAAWDSTPDPEVRADTDLTAEIGRRVAAQVSFAIPSETGTIFIPGGNFDVSVTPTRYVYIRGSFDLSDSVGSTIREAGVFAYTILNGGLPPSQRYFLPADLQDKGLMLINTRFTAFQRVDTDRRTFEFVVTIP